MLAHADLADTGRPAPKRVFYGRGVEQFKPGKTRWC